MTKSLFSLIQDPRIANFRASINRATIQAKNNGVNDKEIELALMGIINYRRLIRGKLMTKLTQQEIEQERVKFEEAIQKSLPDLVSIDRARNGDKGYMNWDVAVGFRMWLARAELAKGE